MESLSWRVELQQQKLVYVVAADLRQHLGYFDDEFGRVPHIG